MLKQTNVRERILLSC